MKISKRIFFVLIFLIKCGYKAPPPGKPDFEPPEIKVLNLKDKDTLRDTTEILLEVTDQSKIIWVKMIINGKEEAVDTNRPYKFILFPPDTILKIKFSAMDFWENIGNSKIFTIFGPFIDTLKTDTTKTIKERK